jgi:hypothetical protein
MSLTFEKELLTSAFEKTSLDLDQGSISVIYTIMIKNKISITRLENDYYIRDGATLIEFKELEKVVLNPHTTTPRIRCIADPVRHMINIQNGKLAKSCDCDGVTSRCPSCEDNGITISANVNVGLTIRYLYEKVKILENKPMDKIEGLEQKIYVMQDNEKLLMDKIEVLEQKMHDILDKSVLLNDELTVMKQLIEGIQIKGRDAEEVDLQPK